MSRRAALDWEQKAAIIAVVLALAAGTTAFFIPPAFLEKILLLFSSDGQIQPKTLLWVQDILHRSAPRIVVVAAAIAVYAAAGLRLAWGPALEEAHDAAPSAREKGTGLALVLLLLLALEIRWPLMSRSFSFDELMTWMSYAKPARLESLLSSDVGNHIAYTFLALISTGVLGISEWSLRLPALILGLAAIAAVWLWLKRDMGSRVAFLAAAFLAISPVHAIFSASARGYSGAIFCAAGSMALFFQCLRRPSRGAAAAFTGANLLGLLFHPMFLLLLLAQIFALIVSNGVRPGAMMIWRSQGLVFCCAGIGYLRRLWYLASEILRESARPPARTFSADTFRELLGVGGMALWAVLGVIVLGAWVMRQSRMKECSYVLAFLAACAVFLSWVVAPAYLWSRYWAFMLPLLLIGLASGLAEVFDKMRPRSLLWAVLTAGFLSGLVITGWVFQEPRIAREYTMPFREIAAIARERAEKETAFFAVGHGAAYFSYYYPDRPISDIRNVADYRAFIRRNPKAACFALADSDQAPGPAEVLRDVRSRAKEYRARELAVYFLE